MDANLENELTREYIDRYGRDKVCGGGFCKCSEPETECETDECFMKKKKFIEELKKQNNVDEEKKNKSRA